MRGEQEALKEENTHLKHQVITELPLPHRYLTAGSLPLPLHYCTAASVCCRL